MSFFPGVQFRHVIKQEASSNMVHAFDFEPENTWPLQLQGREQAKAEF